MKNPTPMHESYNLLGFGFGSSATYRPSSGFSIIGSKKMGGYDLQFQLVLLVYSLNFSFFREVNSKQ